VSIRGDYRYTESCPKLLNVGIKKNSLEKEIRLNCPRAKIIYNYVKNRSGSYFSKFADIYNSKCAYCGADLRFTDGRLFEVDHFVCKSSFSADTDGRGEAGKMDNLVLSCYSCNRGKGSLLVTEEYRYLINPDDSSIASVFFRDENYYIKTYVSVKPAITIFEI